MLYSSQGNFLFVHVSRTGGVAIQRCLENSLNPIVPITVEQHSPLFDARKKLGKQFDTTFKFAMVRNPWDRMVSWYAYICKVKLQQTGDIIADPSALHWQEFDSYLDAVFSETYYLENKQCLVMSQFDQLACIEGTLLVDAFGRFENLLGDFNQIKKNANIHCPPLTKMNESSHINYQHYYTDYGRELVQEKLHKDLSYFSYSFN